MSAAANAAGYLYVHGQLPVSDLNTRAEAARPEHTARAQQQPVKQTRTPKIQYRKRRSYDLPAGLSLSTP